METPDIHFLRAAEGWLELGNPDETRLELARVSPENQSHSNVLCARWHIEERCRDFDACVDIARAMIRANAKDPRGYMNLSNALFFAGKTDLAYQHGLESAARFPSDPAQPYNMACYACQMGRLDEAKSWLRRAMALGNSKVVKNWARNDPDLAPLRHALRLDEH
jgi:tetratricopeptide (TPR) repeat protein